MNNLKRDNPRDVQGRIGELVREEVKQVIVSLIIPSVKDHLVISLFYNICNIMML